MENKSQFTGEVLPFIGYSIVSSLLTIFTLGIAFPWAICIMHSWTIDNTIVDGRKLVFDGTGSSLLGNWIKWWFFCIITFGIYSFWVPIKIEQWKAEHTHFADFQN